ARLAHVAVRLGLFAGAIVAAYLVLAALAGPAHADSGHRVPDLVRGVGSAVVASSDDALLSAVPVPTQPVSTVMGLPDAVRTPPAESTHVTASRLPQPVGAAAIAIPHTGAVGTVARSVT